MRDSTTYSDLLNQLAKTDISAMDSDSPALAWENVKNAEISSLTRYFGDEDNINKLTAEDIFLVGILLQIIASKWPTSGKINKLVSILAKQQTVSLLDLSNVKPTPGRVFKSSPFAVLNATLLLMQGVYEANIQEYLNALNTHKLLLINSQTAILAEAADSDKLDTISKNTTKTDSSKSIRSNIIDVELEIHTKAYMHELLSHAFIKLNMELINALGIILNNRTNLNAKDYIDFLLNYPLRAYLTSEAQTFILCNVIVLAAELNDKQTFIEVVQNVLRVLKSDIHTVEKQAVVLQLSQSLSNSQKITFAKILRDNLTTTKADKDAIQYPVSVLKMLYQYGFANHDRRHLEAQAKSFMQFISSPSGSISEDMNASRSVTPSIDSLSGSQAVLISAQVLNWMRGDTSTVENEVMETLASYDFSNPATFVKIDPKMQAAIKALILRMSANTLAINRHERQADIISAHNIKCASLDLERYIRDVMYYDSTSCVRLHMQDISKQNAVNHASALICISHKGAGVYEVYNPSTPYGSLQFVDTQSTLQLTRAALFGLKEVHCGLHELTSYIRSLFPTGTTALKVTHYAGYRQRPVSMYARAQTPTEGITEKLPSTVPLVRVKSAIELASVKQINFIREQVRNGMPVTGLLHMNKGRGGSIDCADSPHSRPLGTPLLSAYLGGKPRAIPGEGTVPEHVHHILVDDTEELSATMPALNLNPGL